TSGLYAGSACVLHNAMPKILGSLGMKFGYAQSHFIHFAGLNEFDRGPIPGFFEGLICRLTNIDMTQAPNETSGDSRPFGRGIGTYGYIVHVKIMPNNRFVTVTYSKGNKKMGAYAGSLANGK
ncbi:hypothetical protein Tco_1391708, partial [Tanacetum coccineum]